MRPHGLLQGHHQGSEDCWEARRARFIRPFYSLENRSGEPVVFIRSQQVRDPIWQPPTIRKVYPIRWQIELIFKSWKSYLHLASIKTKKVNQTLCYLYGRMLLIVLNYALCPQLRATLWVKKQRELSVLKLVRHFQALADRWMQAIFQSEFVLRRFLQRACTTAERLVAKASRKRHTTAQILRESLAKQDEAIALMEAVNA